MSKELPNNKIELKEVKRSTT